MNTSEDNIKRASELLLKGASMLNLACPDCKNPIYKLINGSMLCPECDKPIVLERDASKLRSKFANLKHSEIVAQKIEILTKSLKDENNPDEIIKLAETIKRLKEIL